MRKFYFILLLLLASLVVSAQETVRGDLNITGDLDVVGTITGGVIVGSYDLLYINQRVDTSRVNEAALDVRDDSTNANVAPNTAHRALTNDPHSVTKAQVGLSNVENTVLSTWAGSTNITTLGTVVSGTYNSTITDITQVTNRSHTDLSDIGSNTHDEIDTDLLNLFDLATTITYDANWVNDVASDGITGDATALTTVGDDDTLQIEEAVGGTSFDTRVSFKTVTEFNNVLVLLQYTGGAGHEVHIELYNPNTTAWAEIAVFSDMDVQTLFNIPIINGADYIDGDSVIVRFDHESNGIATHFLWIDYLVLQKTPGFGGAGVTSHYALSNIGNDTHDELETAISTNTSGWFNVKSYGAVGDDVTDDTEAIQSAIDAAKIYSDGWDQDSYPSTGSGAVVYFPAGKYMTTDSLVVSEVDGIEIRGDGRQTIIRSEATGKSIIKIRESNKYKIKDLILEGNTLNGHGIELQNGTYGTIENVSSLFPGGHGIYYYGGCWGNNIIDCQILYSGLDGINAINSNGFENGNALTVMNSEISGNNGDGIDWASVGLLVFGNTIELNKGSGVQIGGEDSEGNTYNATIYGNYFEGNDSAQIKIHTCISPNRTVRGVNIDANFLLGSNTQGDTCIIMQVSQDSYSGSLFNTYIGRNHYSMSGGYVNTYVYLEDSRDSDEVYSNYDTAPYIHLGGEGTINFNGVPIIKPEVVFIQAGGWDGGKLYSVIQVYAEGATDITDDPQVPDGYFDGQTIMFIGWNDSSPLTFDDGTGLQLAGGESCVLGGGDVLKLMWLETNDVWIEILRSDN